MNVDQLDRMLKFTNSYSFLVAEYRYDVAIQETSILCYGVHIVRSHDRPAYLFETGGLISVPRAQLILPRADAECGKVFYDERRTADEYRIALDFWNQATGNLRKGYCLAVYRCKRCGGFHIAQKRIKDPSAPTDLRDPHHRVTQDQCKTDRL